MNSAASAQVPGPRYPFVMVGENPGTLTMTAHCVYFQTEAGKSYDFQLNSKQFDAYLTIGIGENCDNFAAYLRNDDSGGTYNARLSATAGGGAWIIRIGARSDGRGVYNLTIAELESATSSLPVGLVIAGAPAPLPKRDPTLSASTAIPSGESVPAAGSTFQDCANCPMMLVVPGGTFVMGTSSSEEGRQTHEGPRHSVTIDRAFAIGKFEVTFDEWDACVQARGCSRKPADQGWGRGRRPVIDVSWKDADQYVRWLSKTTGKEYFLPSEAEWEYATRAGTTTPWNTGDAIITDDANILNALGRTVPVGGFPANAFGLHDTHGNVAEWVSDCYEVGYFGVPTNGGPMYSEGCAERVVRDGGFPHKPDDQRSGSRKRDKPTATYTNLGFRVARAL